MTGGSKPIWLHEEREIVALLGEALDRFDRQPGEQRQRNVSLAAERYLPSLRSVDALADQTWALVQELARRGVLSIRRPRRGPYDAEWNGAKLVFAPASESVLRTWLQRGRSEPAMQVWRRAVEQRASLFPGGCEPLLARRIAIPERSPDEVLDAVARLGDIRAPATLRQLSAYAFWGDSKVLDDREELVAALFPNLEIRSRPVVVSVFLPPVIAGALFIENQDTYTAGIAGVPTASAQHALIYMAGFRSTAVRIRTAEGVCLHFAGAGEQREWFERWWFHGAPLPGPACFWGDLDFAGMQMLKILRQRFGDLSAWRPGYGPMLQSVQRGGGRASSGSDWRRQVDPGSTGCAYADTELLPAIRQHGFLDQEGIAQVGG